MRALRRAAAAIAAISVLAAAQAWAGPPRGPPFGNNRYTTTIDPVAQTPDEDDYVAALVRGESLSVTVSADGDLFPTLRLVDPGGSVINPGAAPRKHGREVLLRRFAVDSTGRWTVRVGGADSSQGRYTVKFKVGPPRSVRLAKRQLGGEEPFEAEHAFEAIEGSTLSFTIHSAGAPVSVRTLTDPSGRDVTPAPEALRVRRGRVSAAGLRLTGGDGTWRLGLAIDGGEAAYSVVLRVRPPERPSGRAELSGHEPFLTLLDGPLDGTSGEIARLPGANLPVGPPFPAVFLGDTRCGVVASMGYYVDVVPPLAPDDAVVDVTVVNPDGQAVTRAGHFHFMPRQPLDVVKIEPSAVVLQEGAAQTFLVTLNHSAPPLGEDVALAATDSVGTVPASVRVAGGARTVSFPLLASSAPGTGSVTASIATSVSAAVTVAPPAELLSITPSPAVVDEGASQIFTLTLTGPAPPAGLDVALAVTGGLGTVPPGVHIAGESWGAGFVLTAAPVRAVGTITATSANSVSADVSVLPPTTIDLSGWKIDQTNSARTYTIPAGTLLHEGGYLVVGRNATRTAFEAFWGRTFGSDVVYWSGGDAWPNMNGDETFTLRDATGAVVDGPTIPMAGGGGSVYSRKPGESAALVSSWTSGSATTKTNANPGSGQSPPLNPAGVYVSEFGDPPASGNFIYEFVEIHFDRLP
jgi:hypothetical protein